MAAFLPGESNGQRRLEGYSPWGCRVGWTVAHHTTLSVGFSRQEYWGGFPFPSSGDPPDPGIEPTSPALAGRFFTTEPPGKPCGKEQKIQAPNIHCIAPRGQDWPSGDAE